MNKAGLVILVASIIAAGFLLVLWFVGVLLAIAGGLIHLLLVLALLVGSIGGIVGIVLMIIGKNTPHA